MSLVEVAVALVLAGFGVSAAARAGTAAARIARGARDTTLALAHAGAIADSLAGATVLVADSVVRDGSTLAWRVDGVGADRLTIVVLRVVPASRGDTLQFRFLAGPPVPRLD